MAITNFSRRRSGDAEVLVRLTADGHVATGHIDARQQRDDVWEAWVDYSYPTGNGFSSHHKDWFPMSELEVIDYVPASSSGR